MDPEQPDQPEGSGDGRRRRGRPVPSLEQGAVPRRSRRTSTTIHEEDPEQSPHEDQERPTVLNIPSPLSSSRRRRRSVPNTQFAVPEPIAQFGVERPRRPPSITQEGSEGDVTDMDTRPDEESVGGSVNHLENGIGDITLENNGPSTPDRRITEAFGLNRSPEHTFGHRTIAGALRSRGNPFDLNSSLPSFGPLPSAHGGSGPRIRATSDGAIRTRRRHPAGSYGSLHTTVVCPLCGKTYTILNQSSSGSNLNLPNQPLQQLHDCTAPANMQCGMQFNLNKPPKKDEDPDSPESFPVPATVVYPPPNTDQDLESPLDESPLASGQVSPKNTIDEEVFKFSEEYDDDE